MSDDPAPRELREFFNRAVATFVNWRRSGIEPRLVYIRRDGVHIDCTIPSACDTVRLFDDPMPEHLCNVLREEARHFHGDGFHLEQCTYADGARCLQLLYDAQLAIEEETRESGR